MIYLPCLQMEQTVLQISEAPSAPARTNPSPEPGQESGFKLRSLLCVVFPLTKSEIAPPRRTHNAKHALRPCSASTIRRRQTALPLQPRPETHSGAHVNLGVREREAWKLSRVGYRILWRAKPHEKPAKWW